MMQPRTVFCEIQGNFFDPLALHVSAYLGHHHILARIPNIMLDEYEFLIWTHMNYHFQLLYQYLSFLLNT